MIRQLLTALAGNMVLANIILSLLFLEVKRMILKKSSPSVRGKLLRWSVFALLFWFLISSLRVNVFLLAVLFPVSYAFSLWFYAKFLFKEINPWRNC